MQHSRWEYGGDFPWPYGTHLNALARHPDEPEPFPGAEWFGTGRAAFLALLELGAAQRGWRRLLAPSCFCPRVMATLEKAHWKCVRYSDNPLRETPGLPTDLQSGDVVLRMNYFGWRDAAAIHASAALPCDTIEDHTHDPIGPWARGSQATYCLVSLRKLIPVPDGAVLWSPRHAPLPETPLPTMAHLSCAGLKLGGMVLKQYYRAGENISKTAFRDVLVEGEALLGTGEATGMHPVSRALAETLSPTALARRRTENVARLLNSAPFLRPFVPKPALPAGQSPFALILHFPDNAMRERVRLALIERRVYPPILWSLPDSADPATRDFGARMLLLPCHYYFEDADLGALCETFRQVI